MGEAATERCARAIRQCRTGTRSRWVRWRRSAQGSYQTQRWRRPDSLLGVGTTAGRDFAAAWRHQRKWVVSRSLKSVGPNATLVEGDLEATIRGLKAQLGGQIDVGGPNLARSLTDLGLIDEYRLYFRPFVVGHGTPFFAGPRPPLRFLASDLISEDAIRLTYVPA